MQCGLVHGSAFAPGVLRVGLTQVFGRTGHTAADADGKDADDFAAEVVRFDDGVDDGGGSVPPDGEPYPVGAVIGNVAAFVLDGIPRGLVLLLT